MKTTAKNNFVPILGIGVLVAAIGAFFIQSASAAPVVLGTTTNFAVLASSTVTNTGTTVISGTAGGDIGISPGSSFSDLGSLSTNGVQHLNDAVAITAQTDLVDAWNDAAGRTPVTEVPTELGSTTLLPGSYNTANGELGITGVLTLDGQNDPNAIFIFIAESTLITASSSSVVLINEAQPCNVIWIVGSSATLGTNSTMIGRVMAMASITATTGAEIEGQLLARTGAVTLDSNIITNNVCAAVPTDTATPTDSASPSVTPTDLPATSTPWSNLMGLGLVLTLAAMLGVVLRRRIQG